MKYSSKDYDFVDRTALQLRLDYGYTSKIIDIFSLAKDLNMQLIKYSSLTNEQRKKLMSFDETKDGFTVMKTIEGELHYYTFYNDMVSPSRIKTTIAHEIKHVVFNEKEPTEKDEDLANHFARYIQVPTCLAMNYVNLSPVDIIYDFDVSTDIATNAFVSAKNRIEWNHSTFSELEKEFIKKIK